MDHDEVRKYPGWHHHMLTSMLAHFFLWHVKLRLGEKSGFVANFAQEVMKGHLPWSVEGLRGQGRELFGRSEAFVSLLHHHLPFLHHVHEFDPN